MDFGKRRGALVAMLTFLVFLELGNMKSSLNRNFSFMPCDFQPNPALQREEPSEKETLWRELLKERREAALLRAASGSLSWDKIQAREPHPAFSVRDERYFPLQSDFTNIFVAGLLKCGTSQLYGILESHHDVLGMFPIKEQCPPSIDEKGDYGASNSSTKQPMPTPDQQAVQKAFFQLLESSRVSRSHTVNGCLDPFRTNRFLNYAIPRNKKIITLVRDPADWLWAVYNFWTNEGDAEQNLPSSWTKSGKNYRTPEHFHELVVAGNKLIGFKRSFFSVLDRAFQLYKTVGPENMVIVNNEDLEPSRVALPGGLLDKLANFTGLDRSGFSSTVYNSVRNCNDHKGVSATCSNTSTGRYSISGHRDMLPETRTLIYLLNWEECKFLAKEFGIVYEDCVNIVDASDARVVL